MGPVVLTVLPDHPIPATTGLHLRMVANLEMVRRYAAESHVLWEMTLTVLLELVIKVKGYFGIDDWFGFGAAYGFLCCVAMVLVAKGLGLFLKRPDDYYSREDADV